MNTHLYKRRVLFLGGPEDGGRYPVSDETIRSGRIRVRVGNHWHVYVMAVRMGNYVAEYQGQEIPEEA